MMSMCSMHSLLACRVVAWAFAPRDAPVGERHYIADPDGHELSRYALLL